MLRNKSANGRPSIDQRLHATSATFPATLKRIATKSKAPFFIENELSQGAIPELSGIQQVKRKPNTIILLWICSFGRDRYRSRAIARPVCPQLSLYQGVGFPPRRMFPVANRIRGSRQICVIRSLGRRFPTQTGSDEHQPALRMACRIMGSKLPGSKLGRRACRPYGEHL